MHPMLDEDDNSEPLDAMQASVYRSWIGILLYVSSDYIECQYAIRGLFSVDVQAYETVHGVPQISLHLSPRLHRPMYDAEVRDESRTFALQP